MKVEITGLEMLVGGQPFEDFEIILEEGITKIKFPASTQEKMIECRIAGKELFKTFFQKGSYYIYPPYFYVGRESLRNAV